jgi:hypothetical protein
MLNHVRCLLMNVPGSAGSFDAPGEEAVDPAYVPPPSLPAALRTVRSVLFGADPDRTMLNYRCAQLLAVVHASPLAGFVTRLDPRLTYPPADPSLADAGPWTPAAYRTAGGPDDALAVTGAPEAPDVIGRCRHAFAVDVPSEGQARVERLTTPAQIALFSPADPLPLTGSGYLARLRSASVGQAWRVDVLNRPQYDLSSLAASLASAGEPTLDALFGVSAAEPYRTFRNLWFRNRELPLRLAAAALALAYRTEERRAAA